MSSFTEPLTVTKINSRLWKIEREFIYFIGKEDSDEFVVVPIGFTTDFASVPRLFWTILPPDGTYTQAAVLHDYLYHTQQYSRKRSDEIFYEAMGILKVPRWKKWIMYKCVRLFGGKGWNDYRRKQEGTAK